MNDIKIGDTVICINNSNYTKNIDSPPLKLNGEYIVQGINTCKCGNIKNY